MKIQVSLFQFYDFKMSIMRIKCCPKSIHLTQEEQGKRSVLMSLFLHLFLSFVSFCRNIHYFCSKMYCILYSSLLIYGPNMCFYFQHFALGKGDEEVISTLHYFSKVVDEVI